MKIVRGPKVSYLGITLDFSVQGKAKCTMEGYIADLLRECGVQGRATSPAGEDLFDIGRCSAPTSASDSTR